MKNLQQIRTTLIGLVALLIPIAVGVGWISPDNSGPLGEGAGIFIEGLFAAIGAVAGIWAIFKTNDQG